MNKILLTLGVCFFLTLSAFAQQPERKDRPMFSPEEMAKRQTQMMKDSLQLDEKQVAKIEAINAEYAKKMQKVREREITDMEKRQEIQILRTDQDYELKKVLNKDQAKRFQKMQEAMRAKRQERMKERDKGN
jgi:LAS superfamily LD-carboxypeptidase LdcB